MRIISDSCFFLGGGGGMVRAGIIGGAMEEGAVGGKGRGDERWRGGIGYYGSGPDKTVKSDFPRPGPDPGA